MAIRGTNAEALAKNECFAAMRLANLVTRRAVRGCVLAAVPLATLAAILLTLGLIFLEYDILTSAHESPTEELWLEIEEAFALSLVLVVGLFIISYRHMRAQRRELERRLAAEVEARKALELALLDPLTGLANRRHFEDIFHAAAEKRQEARHALLLLDLDGFKGVNDIYGHPEGDEVLRVVSARLSGAVKADDLVSRVGGDEFSIVAFDVGDAEGARALALRLINVVAHPIKVGTRTHEISVSIGFTMFPEEGRGAAEIYARADAALYRAKATKQARQPVRG